MQNGEVVVITGASAGAGRAVAREFARHGAAIGLIARGVDGLEGARRDVEELGGKALVLQVDVAKPDQVEAAAERVENELGPIDIWVNDAMTSVFAPIKEMTADEFRRVTEVTYLGYVYGTLAALKRMLPRDRGTIVHVGSALAYRSIPLQAAYCASKHAVLGFFAALRTELLHDQSKVRTTMVQMPALNTPNLDGCETRCRAARSPYLPSFSRKWQRGPFIMLLIIPSAASTSSAVLPLRPSSATSLLLPSPITFWRATDMSRSSTTEPSHSTGPTICMSPCQAIMERTVRSARARDSSYEFWAESHVGTLAGCLAVVAAGALPEARARLIFAATGKLLRSGTPGDDGRCARGSEIPTVRWPVHRFDIGPSSHCLTRLGAVHRQVCEGT